MRLLKPVVGPVPAALCLISMPADANDRGEAVRAPDAIHWTVRTFNGVTRLFMVNDSRRPRRATVRAAGHTARLHGEGLSVFVRSRRYDITPLEVRIEEWGA